MSCQLNTGCASKYGGVAQLGERTVRIRKVKGSNPSVSTMKRSSCHRQGLLFILKEMGIRTRGLLETCRGKKRHAAAGGR